MKEKIFALLSTTFSGVRKDGLSQLARTLALQVATEEEAKIIVEKLTRAQVDDFVKDYRADVDKEVSEGNKTYESNLKKKFDLVEKKTEEPLQPVEPASDLSAQIKAAVSEAIKPFQEKLSGYEKETVAQQRLHALNAKLETCKDNTLKTRTIKDFNRAPILDEQQFDEYLTELETDIATANQNIANIALGGQGRPIFGSHGKTDEDSFIQSMKEINKPEQKES